MLLSESLATWNKVWFDIFERLESLANLSLILRTAGAGLLVSVEARVGRPRGVGSAGAAGVDRGSSWNLGAITIVINLTERESSGYLGAEGWGRVSTLWPSCPPVVELVADGGCKEKLAEGLKPEVL